MTTKYLLRHQKVDYRRPPTKTPSIHFAKSQICGNRSLTTASTTTPVKPTKPTMPISSADLNGMAADKLNAIGHIYKLELRTYEKELDVYYEEIAHIEWRSSVQNIALVIAVPLTILALGVVIYDT